jgi:hypothetical protein
MMKRLAVSGWRLESETPVKLCLLTCSYHANADRYRAETSISVLTIR